MKIIITSKIVGISNSSKALALDILQIVAVAINVRLNTHSESKNDNVKPRNGSL